ncbi:MAG: hypothetical protein II132_05155 [Desulfovibrio sp.]|nr:hypothetical protein [Desulfovibrio sp.]
MRRETILPLLLSSMICPAGGTDAGAYETNTDGSKVYGITASPNRPAQNTSLDVDDALASQGFEAYYAADGLTSRDPVSGNTLVLRTSAGTNVGPVYAGYADYANAVGNTLVIESGFAQTQAAAGLVNTEGNAEDNAVFIYGGGVLGSELDPDSYAELTGGCTYDFFGIARNNSIDIYSGTFSHILIAGGYSLFGTAEKNRVSIGNGYFSNAFIAGGRSEFGSAQNNSVSISGGTFTNAVIAGGRSEFGSAQSNSVSISGGTFTNAVIAGGAAEGNCEDASATGNAVTISGAPVFDNVSLYGGLALGLEEGASPAADLRSDNTLRIYDAANLRTASIANFSVYDFRLGDTAFENGSSVLLIANSGGTTDLGHNPKFTVALSSDAGIAAGHTAHLLTELSGAFKVNGAMLTGTPLKLAEGLTVTQGVSLEYQADIVASAQHVDVVFAGTAAKNADPEPEPQPAPRQDPEPEPQQEPAPAPQQKPDPAPAPQQPLPPQEPDPAPVPQAKPDQEPAPGTKEEPKSDPAPEQQDKALQKKDGQDNGRDAKKEVKREVKKEVKKEARRKNAAKSGKQEAKTRVQPQASPAPAPLRLLPAPKPRVSQRTKAIATGSAAGLVHLNTAGDLVAGRTMESLRQAIPSNAPRLAFVPFAAVSSGMVHSKGAHARLAPTHLTAGIAGVVTTPDLCFAIGPFFEAGKSRLATDHSFAGEAPVSGTGRLSHLGAGLLSRLDFKSAWIKGLYAEASFRAGTLETLWKTEDMADGFTGRRASYDVARPYTACHAGLGWRLPVSDQLTLDLGARWFWTRLWGGSAHVASDPYEFRSADSSRLKFTAKASLFEGKPCSPYVSASLEREFDGRAGARAFGLKTPESSLRGDTASFGFGLSLNGLKDSGLSVDIGATAQTGVQKGVSGAVLVKYEF